MMKKQFRNFVSIMAGIVLVSCSNDSNDILINEESGNSESASIVLKLANEAAVGTRALGDLQNDRTQNILQVRGTVNIFFFTATGNLVKSDTPLATDLLTGKEYTNQVHGITTAVKEVVIVGNVGDITSGVTNKNTLHAKLNTLEKAQSDYTESTPDIWVYGATTDINWDAQPAVNGVKQGECTVDMAPVLARIDVTINTTGITSGYTPTSLSASNVDFKGIAVLYSGGYSHYIPNFIPNLSAITSGYGAGTLPLRSGLMDTSFPLWTGSSQVSLLTPATGDESILHASWDGTWNSQDNLDATKRIFTRSFYAFPSNTESGYYDRNTIVTLYGDHHDNPGEVGDNVTPLFWAVHFSSSQVLNGGAFSQPLENGTVYNLVIYLNGDYTNGGPGTTDPEEESNPANLTVTMEQVKWKAVIPMEMTFNN